MVPKSLNNNVLFFTFQIIFLSIIMSLPSSECIKCYVCNDCETYFNETHVTECEAKEEKCIKMTEVSGLVSRDCGKDETCTREISGTSKSLNGPPSSPNKQKPEKLSWNNDYRPKRSSSKLLAPAKKVPPGPPPPKIVSLYCCDEDECNGTHSATLVSNFFSLLLIVALQLI